MISPLSNGKLLVIMLVLLQLHREVQRWNTEESDIPRVLITTAKIECGGRVWLHHHTTSVTSARRNTTPLEPRTNLPRPVRVPLPAPGDVGQASFRTSTLQNTTNNNFVTSPPPTPVTSEPVYAEKHDE